MNIKQQCLYAGSNTFVT